MNPFCGHIGRISFCSQVGWASPTSFFLPSGYDARFDWAEGRDKGALKTVFRFISLLLFLAVAPATFAAPANNGQTGFIHMPDARIHDDGVLHMGYSYDDPYRTLWGSITLLPRLELSGRYTEIKGVPGFEDNDDFGNFKDKAFDAKLVCIKESTYVPQVTVGVQDYLGTKILSARYLAVGKKIGDFDLTVGFGEDRIDGAFGGIRYTPSWHKALSLVYEYDANDYENDFRAQASGADQREGGSSYAIEYRYGWLGSQLSYQAGDVGANFYVSVPLMKAAFIPNIDEPHPYTKHTPRPTLSEWYEDMRYRDALLLELGKRGFSSVKLLQEDQTLHLSLTHNRISTVSRLVGRAARIALLKGPQELETIKITYTENNLALVTYTFSDVFILQSYFEGLVPLEVFARTVKVEYTTPYYAGQLAKDSFSLAEIETDAGYALSASFGDDGHVFNIRGRKGLLSNFHVIPFNLRFFFNDPSGAFRYDTYALATYEQNVWDQFFIKGGVRYTLVEDVTEVTQESNSTLPHVRTDIIDYKKGDRLKLDSFLLNQYLHPMRGVYARLSAGYYEEMFAGAGGQVLYLPPNGNWATDLTVDWLKQREPELAFGFREYDVTNALLALHYRVPRWGITTTVRGGQFLAGDDGARLEFKRRFRSGVEVGAWYTYTNGEDTTGPGTPDKPYFDKGVSIYIPLNSMLTRDTRSTATLSLSPWTRDVGQMVVSPGDLYRMVERPLMLDSADHTYFSDLNQ